MRQKPGARKRHGEKVAKDIRRATRDIGDPAWRHLDIFAQDPETFAPAEVDPDLPRRSLWTVEHNMPDSEMDARYKISSSKPRYFHYSNPAREGHLGHTPGWMIHHGSIAYGPFDYVNDPSMKRNAYIEYSVWNTVYDPDERYAGGRYPFQSDGTDTLAEWVKEDQPLMGQDVVSWFSAGFHHIPRMEDWPVMSTEWNTIHLMPHNFFANNPGMTIRKGQ